MRKKFGMLLHAELDQATRSMQKTFLFEQPLTCYTFPTRGISMSARIIRAN
jgi:hypothetical protein